MSATSGDIVDIPLSSRWMCPLTALLLGVGVWFFVGCREDKGSPIGRGGLREEGDIEVRLLEIVPSGELTEERCVEVAEEIGLQVWVESGYRVMSGDAFEVAWYQDPISRDELADKFNGAGSPQEWIARLGIGKRKKFGDSSSSPFARAFFADGGKVLVGEFEYNQLIVGFSNLNEDRFFGRVWRTDSGESWAVLGKGGVDQVASFFERVARSKD